MASGTERRRRRSVRMEVGLLAVVLLPRCATLGHGTGQSVSITSTPTGAAVLCDGIASPATTPATIRLDRGAPHTIMVRKPGYEERTVYVWRKLSGLSFLNCLWVPVYGAGLLGWVVDAADGAMWKFEPETFRVVLEPRPPSAAPATGQAPPVVTYAPPPVVLPPPPDRAEPVAVLDFYAPGVLPEGLASRLDETLRETLAGTGFFRVLDRKRMETELERDGFSLATCAGAACAAQAGRLLSVRQVVTGSLRRVGESYLVSVQLTDVESGALLRTGREACSCRVEDLPEVVATAGKRLVEGMPHE